MNLFWRSNLAILALVLVVVAAGDLYSWRVVRDQARDAGFQQLAAIGRVAGLNAPISAPILAPILAMTRRFIAGLERCRRPECKQPFLAGTGGFWKRQRPDKARSRPMPKTPKSRRLSPRARAARCAAITPSIAISSTMPSPILMLRRASPGGNTGGNASNTSKSGKDGAVGKEGSSDKARFVRPAPGPAAARRGPAIRGHAPSRVDGISGLTGLGHLHFPHRRP